MNRSVAVVVAIGVAVACSLAMQQAQPAQQPVWEYAEMTIRQSYIDGPLYSVRCPEIGLKAEGPVSDQKTEASYVKDALAAMPGTGATILNKMGSQGWEAVSSGVLRDQNALTTRYLFKRRVK